MRNAVKLLALAALVLMVSGWLLAGCKSAPDLTSDQAKTLIQAKYDQDPGFAYNISVDDRGMQLGVHANYWLGQRRYPNGYWGDFKLTDDGKKVLKLQNLLVQSRCKVVNGRHQVAKCRWIHRYVHVRI